ncbi:hypothetical protein C0992_012391, partial [Termitomyces sp. T32_za158]
HSWPICLEMSSATLPPRSRRSSSYSSWQPRMAPVSPCPMQPPWTTARRKHLPTWLLWRCQRRVLEKQQVN